MATNEAPVKKNGLSNRQAFVLALLTAVLSGSGAPYLLSSLGINPYRPDPFTRSDARILENRIAPLERHIENHPDEEREFDKRITTLEVKLDVLLVNQERILDRLESR